VGQNFDSAVFVEQNFDSWVTKLPVGWVLVAAGGSTLVRVFVGGEPHMYFVDWDSYQNYLRL
jgi:hypothetical protein